MFPFLPEIITGGLNLIGDIVSQGNARNAFKHRYQDTVADQRAAGLNPALAYGQGGGNPQTADFGDIGSAAAQGAQSIASARQARAQTHLTESQANLLDRQADDLAMTTQANRGYAVYRQQNEDSKGHILRNKEGRLDATNAQWLERYRTGTELMQNQLPESRAYAKYYSSAYGKNEPYMQSARDWSDAATRWAPWANKGPQDYRDEMTSGRTGDGRNWKTTVRNYKRGR